MVLFCLSDSIHYMFTLFLYSTLPSVLSFLRVKLCFDVMKVCVTCPNIPQKGIGASVTNSLGRTLCGWVRPRKKSVCWYKCSFVLIQLAVSQTSWRRHQMEAFSALLAICAVNSPVSGEFPSQRPVTRSFDVFFDLNNDWVNNHQAGDLRRHRAHYDVTVMLTGNCGPWGRYRILRHSFKLLRRW